MCRFYSKLKATASQVARSESLLEVMLQVQKMSRDEMKSLSHEGAIYKDRKHWDAGNLAYSLLWQLILEDLGVSCPEHPALKLLTTYPSLEMEARSLGSMELQGDMIECLLATVRLRGPIIPKETSRERELVHSQVRQFASECTFLKLHLKDTEGELPWPADYRDRCASL